MNVERKKLKKKKKSHCAKERCKREWSVLLHSLGEGHFQISFTSYRVQCLH